MSTDTIKNDFGKGGVLIASDPDDNKSDALSVGMIDAVIDSNPVKDLNRDTEFTLKDEETTIMLEELLAKNPSLQLEIDKLVADACADAVSKYSAEIKEANAQALAIAKSDKYPSKIKELSFEVMAGNKPQATLDGAVIAFDAYMETRDIELAAEETEQVGSTVTDESPVEEPKQETGHFSYDQLMEF